MNLAVWVVFSPLIGALGSYIIGRCWNATAGYITAIGCMVGAVICSLFLLLGVEKGLSGVLYLAPWIQLDSLNLYWSIRVDMVTAVMLALVNFISLMVHIYSMSYMAHDPSRVRFISYISLFTFFMLVLVAANDLLQLFVGWEGVGLASYLLIGFWHQKPSAGAAAIKAFVVNRVGDFGLILGIAATFYVFGTIEYDGMIDKLPLVKEDMLSIFGISVSALPLIAILWFIGCMGKSSQIGLHIWLPDAMEGPTPVSALLHSATMVTAGVFLAVRLGAFFDAVPDVLSFIAIIGGLTAFFAGTVALTQKDIKRVIAYSTCSQLGFMFMGIGAGAYSAAFFHLTTHAFFKSLLFLGSGVVIHALADEQNMDHMGGLRRKLPITHIFMVIGTLALAGVPLLSGAFSKDAIMEALWGHGTFATQIAFWIGLVGIALTPLYGWRLMILTFYGPTRSPKDIYDHAHEGGALMLGPMAILAIFSIFLGSLVYPLFLNTQSFWGASINLEPMMRDLESVHHLLWVKLSPVFMVFAGTLLAFTVFLLIKGLPDRLQKAFPALHAISYNKWYFDEIYDTIFVQPAYKLGAFFSGCVDRGMIDRYGPNGAAAMAGFFGRKVRYLQTGQLNFYALLILFGLVLALALLLLNKWGIL